MRNACHNRPIKAFSVHNSVTTVVVLLCLFTLSACHPSSQTSNTPPVSADANANSTTNSLDDSQAFELNDGLIAPTAPILNIDADTRRLLFSWDQRDDTTQATLYTFNSRTRAEEVVDIDIAAEASSAQLDISAHNMAWDSNSYRIELCNANDCISSLRVPLTGLLSKVITTLAAESSQTYDSFGHDVAVNDTGNVIAVAAPKTGTVSVFFELPNGWVQASTLESSAFAQNSHSLMRVNLSASGDTIAVASVSQTDSLSAVFFERLGENWIETDALIAGPAFQGSAAQLTHETLRSVLSEDGERWALSYNPNDETEDTSATAALYQRNTSGWQYAAPLSLPENHTVYAALGASASLSTVGLLSQYAGSVYLHLYAISDTDAQRQSSQVVSALEPSTDTTLQLNSEGSQVAVMGWETGSHITPVVWRYAIQSPLTTNANTEPQALDSIRLPTVQDSNVTLRLAADGQLHTIAAGWQGDYDGLLDVYSMSASHGLWQKNLNLPYALNVTAKSAIVQSVAISREGQTLLIGSEQTVTSQHSGGVVRLF